MSLDNESRKAMIAYRQEKADIAIEDAVFLANASRCHWQANVGDFDCRCDGAGEYNSGKITTTGTFRSFSSFGIH